MHRPQEEYTEATMHVVRYLKGKICYGVVRKKENDLRIHGYTHTEWASNPIDIIKTNGRIHHLCWR